MVVDIKYLQITYSMLYFKYRKFKYLSMDTTVLWL